MKKELTKLREFINNEVEDHRVHKAMSEMLTIFDLVDLRLARNEAWLQQQTAAQDRAAMGGKPGAKK